MSKCALSKTLGVSRLASPRDAYRDVRQVVYAFAMSEFKKLS